MQDKMWSEILEVRLTVNFPLLLLYWPWKTFQGRKGRAICHRVKCQRLCIEPVVTLKMGPESPPSVQWMAVLLGSKNFIFFPEEDKYPCGPQSKRIQLWKRSFSWVWEDLQGCQETNWLLGDQTLVIWQWSIGGRRQRMVGRGPRVYGHN